MLTRTRLPVEGQPTRSRRSPTHVGAEPGAIALTATGAAGAPTRTRKLRVPLAYSLRVATAGQSSGDDRFAVEIMNFPALPSHQRRRGGDRRRWSTWRPARSPVQQAASTVVRREDKQDLGRAHERLTTPTAAVIAPQASAQGWMSCRAGPAGSFGANRPLTTSHTARTLTSGLREPGD